MDESALISEFGLYVYFDTRLECSVLTSVVVLNSSKGTYVKELIERLKKIDITVDSMRAFLDSELRSGQSFFGESLGDAADDWITGKGDWGVAEFANDDIASMRKKLGIPDSHVGLPYFNRVWSLQSKLPNEMDDEHWKKVTELPLKPNPMYKYQVEPLSNSARHSAPKKSNPEEEQRFTFVFPT